MYLFICYIVVVNLYGLFIMRKDKKRAKKHQWRISENALMFISLMFGSLGILLGMILFRHKTKHTKFIIGVPIMLFSQVYILFNYIIK
ncbi:DUF1294 domain-containing protein [Desnuesiella massiliensis]|uniref:DUF1294 domain-containing protein n=1 Tax=Desnuesiella massiliensis TaxID=1650662 RepID=UPI0006E2CF57|nr:DUF1294 domain-containing protein [Desnuesiella massiliensis]